MLVHIAQDNQRRTIGKTNYLAGRAAEQAVMRQYLDNGASLHAERWRGQNVEIDLIFEQNEELIFVEVKKSRCHERAAASLSMQQLRRIAQGACVFASQMPSGDLTVFRIDVALVNGLGDIEIIENVISD